MKCLIMFMLLLACTPRWQQQLTQDDRDFLAQIQNQSNEVIFSKNQDAIIWGRAQSFIAQYSIMRPQIISDYIIQTYNPTHVGQFGYYVTKTPTGDDSLKISIRCIVQSSLIENWENEARWNERIFSWYLQTGKLPINLNLIHRDRN